MNPMEYQQFSEQLTARLAADGRVLGLVAAGSMAAQDTMPDRWSDHDFFVITRPGAQEAMKRDLTWLPQADEIILSFRETAHGMKVLYRRGHLLEMAMFAPDELDGVRLNRHRVLVDKERIADRMATLAALVDGEPYADAGRLFGQLLVNLLVGGWRHARGERLSGRQFVKNHAVYQLLLIWPLLHPLPEGGLLDNLDPFRRVERLYPRFGAELNQILELGTLETAVQLLALAENACRPHLTPFPAEAAQVVRRLLAELAAGEGENGGG